MYINRDFADTAKQLALMLNDEYEHVKRPLSKGYSIWPLPNGNYTGQIGSRENRVSIGTFNNEAEAERVAITMLGILRLMSSDAAMCKFMEVEDSL